MFGNMATGIDLECWQILPDKITVMKKKEDLMVLMTIITI